MEKAQALHDRVMRLLVRRYVTAEQRKRDDFGITEDDIIEVRQDISTLRFELLEIFNQNNMKVPDIEKKQSAGTKKGKVMERRIMKDFQIGIVETLVSEIKKEGGEGGKDVFSSIAKVIGKRTSGKRTEEKKKDWNAIVRQNTSKEDPIGSGRSSMIRRSQRSLRKHIIEQANAGLKMDTEKLVELNPKLSDVTPTTRVAYVKFMSKTLTKREEFQTINEKKEKEGEPSTSGENVDKKLIKSVLSSSKKSKEEPGQQKPAAPAPPGESKPPDAAAKPSAPAAKPAAPSAPAPAAAGPPPPTSGDATKQQTPAATAPGAPPTATTKADEKKDGDKAENKPAGDKPADTKPTDTKPTDSKPAETKPSGTQAADKPSDSKPADKPADSKPTDKPADAKPAGGAAKTETSAKPADKKPAPAPAKAAIRPGQSSAAAGGDRGKSTVTGRMISGWL